MTVNEKVAYLQGLVEGSELNLGAKEKKVVDAMLDVLAEIAKTVQDFDADIENLYEGYDAVCDSIDALEDDLDGMFDIMDDFDDEEYDEEEMLYDVVCPKCSETICIDEDMLLVGDIDCPNCGEKLEFDFDFDCDCEDCCVEDNEEK